MEIDELVVRVAADVRSRHCRQTYRDWGKVWRAAEPTRPAEVIGMEWQAVGSIADRGGLWKA